MSVGDLLDDYFETDELKGAYASSGVVGVWAGPLHARAPPTTCCTTSSASSTACRAPGATCAAAWARSPRRSPPARAPRRDDPHRAPTSPRSTSPAGASPASRSSRRDAHARRSSLSGAHPKRTVLDLVGAEHFPDEVAEDMRRYRTRGGVGEDQRRPLRAAALRQRARGRQRAAAAREPRDLPVDRLPRARLAGRHARRAGGGPVHRGRGPDGGRPDADRRRHARSSRCSPSTARTTSRGLARRRARGLRASAASRHPRPARAERPRRAPRTTRCWRRRTSSGSSASRAARSSRASRTSSRWRSCARRPELARYATPVHGLYLCGAGTHPGGGVIAASGHNAAQRVLRDLRAERIARAAPSVAAVGAEWTFSPHGRPMVDRTVQLDNGLPSRRVVAAVNEPSPAGRGCRDGRCCAAAARWPPPPASARRWPAVRTRPTPVAAGGAGQRRQGPARRSDRRRPASTPPASRSRAATTRSSCRGIGDTVTSSAQARARRRAEDLQLRRLPQPGDHQGVRQAGGRQRPGHDVRDARRGVLASSAPAASTFDVIFSTPDQLSRLVGRQLLQPLNLELVPNLTKNVWPELHSPFYDVGPRYSVPYVDLHDGHRLAQRQDRLRPEQARPAVGRASGTRAEVPRQGRHPRRQARGLGHGDDAPRRDRPQHRGPGR